MKKIVEFVTKHLLETEETTEYLFQYNISVKYNDDLLRKEDIIKKISWIRENYKDILELCYEESRVFRSTSFDVSYDEFMDTIEPISLEFFDTDSENFSVLTFKLGGILEGKFLTVEISDDNEIDSILMRT